MKVIHKKFSELASANGLKLRQEIAADEPVFVIVEYAIVPYTKILFYPPKNSIWKTHPSYDICDDACIPGGDDDVEQLVREEIKAAGCARRPVFGLLDEADNLDMSNLNKPLNCWALGFNCQKERVQRHLAYLQNWWLALGAESLAPVEDNAVWLQTPIRKQYDDFVHSDCGCFMVHLWTMDKHLFSQAKRFIESRSSIVDDVADANAAITPVIEAETAMPGHVIRETIIWMGTPCKRMIELEKLDYRKMLKERDELFFSQCLVVRQLGKVSMYWSVKEVVENFTVSLKMAPYTYSQDPMQELRAYLNDMENRFPILKLSSL